MNHITVRQAQAHDAATVRSILQEAADWLTSRGTPMWRDDELAQDVIEAHVAKGLFWLAEVDGEPAGCIRFQTEDKQFWPDIPPGESAFLHRLAVLRKQAGGVVSAAMMQWAKEHAAALGKQYLRLDCESTTVKLRELYERNGFRRHSERHVGPYLVARYEYELT